MTYRWENHLKSALMRLRAYTNKLLEQGDAAALKLMIKMRTLAGFIRKVDGPCKKKVYGKVHVNLAEDIDSLEKRTVL
jgi:hypothetical protein